jgi:hypothetical protein
VIDALTVCVDYADYLSLGIKRWREGLRSLTVVTAPHDETTQALARAHGAGLHVTDVFYAKGAAFNKGAALEEARERLPRGSWVLLFDADIVPPAGWVYTVSEHRPEPGSLYSCRRVQCADPARIDAPDLPALEDDCGVGYFQLFHSADPIAQARPLIDTFWVHAGNYDDRLKERWPRECRHWLPLRLVHVGERENWFGRGRRAEWEAMQAERRRRGGRWDHETIDHRKVPS